MTSFTWKSSLGFLIKFSLGSSSFARGGIIQHSRYNGSLGLLCIHGHDIDFLAINDLGKLDIYKPELSFSYLTDSINCVCIVASTNDLLLLLLQRRRKEKKEYNLLDINTFYYVWNLVTKEGHAIP